MHTGYDNFWMYQNIRHEPILSFSKSDTYSHAVHTDSYKPLPNGGCPTHLSNYLTSQNNVASSHQSDQSRITSSQCVRPSSVYSLSFRSSYANNFQSPESYSSQSATFNCSTQESQTQQNYNLRHLKNTNLNFPQVFINTNKNNNNYSNSVQTQCSKNNDTSASRIRVKDVFSLNNSTLHNSLFENNLLQPYQNKQPECVLSYARVNPFTSYNSKTPTEYMDYEKINLLKSGHPSPPYRHTGTEQINYEKFLQHSELYYQQNKQLSVENQFQFTDSKEVEKNLPPKAFNANSLIRQLSSSKKIWEAEVQNIQRHSCNAPYKNKRIKFQPKRNSSELSNLPSSKTVCSISREKTNNIHYSGSFEAEKRVMHGMSKINSDDCSQSHYQENLPETDEASSLNQVCLTGELRKCKKNIERVPPNSKCSPNRIKEQENNFIKITIPHTGQCSFVPINDCISGEKNPSPSLPCLLQSDNQLSCHNLNRKSLFHNHCETKENRVMSLSFGQVDEGSSISNKVAALNTNLECNNSSLIQNYPKAEIGEFDRSFHSTLILSPKKLESSNESLLLKEHVSLNNQKNYIFHNSTGLSDNNSESVNPKIFKEEENKSTKIISRKDTISKDIILNQENFCSKVENSTEQSFPGDRAFPQIIKTETNVEDFSLQEHKPESSVSENHLLDIDDTENFDFNKANMENDFSTTKPVPESKIISTALKNAENCIQELDLFVDNSDREETAFLTKNKVESLETERKKVFQLGKNYKSKINKEKLDLLIQFLNKGEETIKTNTSEEAEPSRHLKKTSFTNKREKEIHLNRSRRKLSKTCIVRNKNNSREMISLITHKVGRMDTIKCSPETPEIVQNINNLDQSEKKSEEDSSVTDRSVNLSENCYKINNNSQENKIEKENCLKFESKVNVFECKEKQDISEKYLSGKESSIQEEDNISNTMRTFQNLKTLFCISCNLMSSVDSFWINVISGELRCLNCFKKMVVRAEEHILKSKLAKADDKINLGSNPFQKNEVKQASENMQKPGFENKPESCNKLISIREFECGHQKSIDLKEDFKQESMEVIHESFMENRDEVSFMSECCTVNAVNFSNTSRRQSVSEEDKASILRKTVERQNKLKVEELLNKCEKNVEWKEDVAHKSKDGPKQEMSKRKNITEGNEIPADETQNAGGKASILKSKQMCSSPKTSPLKWSNKEGKNMLKEKCISLKGNVLKNYNEEEKFSDQSASKSNFTESNVTNKTQVWKEDTKPELPYKLEKSSEKNTSKKECISEEFNKIERKKSTDSSNHNKKKTISKEEFPPRKLRISEEYSKKEIRVSLNSLDNITKTCSKESCDCQKIHFLKKNAKHESLDKLKVQNASKEVCSDQKLQVKVKETDIVEKSKGKNLPAQNCTEKHESKKRKNVEGFAAHKIRILEEHAKKEVTPSSHRSKGDSACRKDKTLEHEKQNAKDSEEKSGKNSSSKEEGLNSGNSVKNKANQTMGSSEKSMTKGDLSCQKAKTSEHSKHRRNNSSEMSRRKSKDECISPKPVVTTEHSKNETKRLMESSDKLRRNSISKEDSNSVSKHFKNGSSLTENKECKKTEEKEKHFREKILKKSHSGSDLNINKVLRSPVNYESERISNKERHARITKEYSNGKSKRELLGNGEKNSNKEKKKIKTIANEREVENDSNEKNGHKSQLQYSDEENLKGKMTGCSSEGKAEDVAAKELQPNGGGSEKTVLLTELIKKTKKLSWTLLNASS